MKLGRTNEEVAGSARRLLCLVCTASLLVACGSSQTTSPAPASTVPSASTVIDSVTVSTTDGEIPEEPFFSATLGDPVDGFRTPVDLAVRPGDSPLTYLADQNGIIMEIDADGSPGRTVADLQDSTRVQVEQGFLGLTFDSTGTVAYVNYTDLDGDTVVERFDVQPDGTFSMATRRIIYKLNQPYRNHNGGELLLSPDGRSLLVFTGDGGSANDPERRALDPSSQLGKIIRLDISNEDSPADPEIWASGLRNPWRAAYDAPTGNLWIADVGQNTWEEINVVPLTRSRGVSFGWSALEGTAPFNDDQAERHAAVVAVDPIHTYRHENNDCSIVGGFVYRGQEIPYSGTWYLFTDFCSGIVRALCVTDEVTSCGVQSLGKVPVPVGILPDASGRPWILSYDGLLIPIVPAP